MKASLRYAATGALMLALVIAVLWYFLDPAGRRGVVSAAVIALPVQMTAFGLMVRYRRRFSRFLAVWAGGTLIRMAIVVFVAVLVGRAHDESTVPLLFALAGFFFLLLLLEPLYFRLGPPETVEVR